MRLIAKASASNSASIDMALPAGFSVFRLLSPNALPANDGVLIGLRLSTDGGSNYAASGYISPYHVAGLGYDSHANAGTTAIGLNFARNTSASKSALFDGLLTGAGAGLVPRFVGRGIHHSTNGGMYNWTCTAQYSGSTDRVTHIRFVCATGNLTSGDFYLYGE